MTSRRSGVCVVSMREDETEREAMLSAGKGGCKAGCNVEQWPLITSTPCTAWLAGWRLDV